MSVTMPSSGSGLLLPRNQETMTLQKSPILLLLVISFVLSIPSHVTAMTAERAFVAAMDEVAEARHDAALEQELQRALWLAATPVQRSLEENAAAMDDAATSLDLTKFALKYIGCSNIHTWDDDAAAAGASSPLAMHRFVILRLCEASSCSTYNRWGCNYNYGEYMIPMETYLQIMHQHHVSQFGYYCRICNRCMNYNSNLRSSYSDDDSTGEDDWVTNSAYWGTVEYNEDGVGDDAAANLADDNAGDDYYADDVTVDDAAAYEYNQRQRRMANNNYYSTDDANAGNAASANTPFYIDANNGTCIYESVCSRYKSACSNRPTPSDIQQYFQCQQFTIGNNGNVGYLGPHCRSDGRTIDIGFYADEECNQFLGETQNTNIKTYLNIEASDMDIYTAKSCIPCHATDSFALLTDEQVLDGQGDVPYSLCSALYDPAAKCQRAFKDREESYQSSQELENEESVCEMIKSLVTKTYDEFGDPIVLGDFDLHRWNKRSEYAKLVRKATPLQATLLSFSIVLTLGLFLYAAYLHRKITLRASWPPPTLAGYDIYDPADKLNRGGSGIVANRTGISLGESSQTGGEVYRSPSSSPSNGYAGPSVMA